MMRNDVFWEMQKQFGTAKNQQAMTYKVVIITKKYFIML